MENSEHIQKEGIGITQESPIDAVHTDGKSDGEELHGGTCTPSLVNHEDADADNTTIATDTGDNNESDTVDNSVATGDRAQSNDKGQESNSDGKDPDIEVIKTDDGRTIIVKNPSKSDGLSVGKLVASGAAAITASIITTRLAGTVNGLLIVGCSSIIIAILSEVYRRTLSKLKKISAKAIYRIPLKKVLPDKLASKVNDDLRTAMEDTNTLPVIESVSGVVEPDSSTRQDDEQHGDTSGMVVGMGDVETVDSSDGMDVRAPRLRDVIRSMGFRRGIVHWASLEWKSWSWLTKSMIVVLGVVLLSAGVTTAMSQVLDQPEINVTNVTRHDVKDLSDAEKTAIKNAAVDAVSGQLQSLSSAQSDISERMSAIESKLGISSNAPQPSPSSSPVPTPSPSASTLVTRDDENQMRRDIKELRASVSELQKALSGLEGNGGDGGGSGSTSSTVTDKRMEELNARLESLDARIKALESVQQPNDANGQQGGV